LGLIYKFGDIRDYRKSSNKRRGRLFNFPILGGAFIRGRRLFNIETFSQKEMYIPEVSCIF